MFCKEFDKSVFGKKTYGHGNKGSMLNISLPCPIPSCRFGGFNKIFDDCSEDLKYYTTVEQLNCNRS